MKGIDDDGRNGDMPFSFIFIWLASLRGQRDVEGKKRNDRDMIPISRYRASGDIYIYIFNHADQASATTAYIKWKLNSHIHSLLRVLGPSLSLCMLAEIYIFSSCKSLEKHIYLTNTISQPMHVNSRSITL